MYKPVFAPTFFTQSKGQGSHTWSHMWYEILPNRINYHNPQKGLERLPDLGSDYFKLAWTNSFTEKLWFLSWKREYHNVVVVRINHVRKEVEFVLALFGKDHIENEKNYTALWHDPKFGQYELKFNTSFLLELPWRTIYVGSAISEVISKINLSNPETGTEWLPDCNRRMGNIHFRRLGVPVVDAHYRGNSAACLEAILIVDDHQKTIEVFAASATTCNDKGYHSPSLDMIFQDLESFLSSHICPDSWRGKVVIPQRPATV